MKALSTKLGLAVVGLSLGTPVHAQALREANVQADWVDEGYIQNVPVSGRVVVGTMFIDAGRPSGDTLYVSVNSAPPASVAAAPDEDLLCLNLASRDGSYKGIWKTTLPDIEPPYLLRVQYTSRARAFYEDARARELVALATLKDSCEPGGAVKRILPVAWTPPYDANRLRIFINSSRMRTLLAIPLQGQGVEAVECQPIQAAQKIAFDRYCDIDVKALEAAEKEPQYEQAALLRYRGPNRAPVVPLPLSR
ncbi:hypothetical protein [Halomonas sp. WWR20]